MITDMVKTDVQIKYTHDLVPVLLSFYSRDGMASTYPEPEDKEAYIRTLLYDYNYEGETNLPKTWTC